METRGRIRVGVAKGMRGYFAVLYDDDGPIESGVGSFGTYAEAHEEAVAWAQSEGLIVDEYKEAT